jgi:hypothetical protein
VGRKDSLVKFNKVILFDMAKTKLKAKVGAAPEDEELDEEEESEEEETSKPKKDTPPKVDSITLTSPKTGEVRTYSAASHGEKWWILAKAWCVSQNIKKVPELGIK